MTAAQNEAIQMITVTVTQGGAVLDELQFDDANILHHDGGVAMIHRDVMKHCAREGIWYRVARAAAWIAETGSLLDALASQASTSSVSAIDRLLERLQTGWQPKRDKIDPAVPQRDLRDWDFWKSGKTLIGYPSDEPGWAEVEVLWIDAGLQWVLCVDGFYWL